MTNTDGSRYENCLYRVEQLQKGEKRAAEASAMNMMQLMSAAGKAVFKQLQRRFPADRKSVV